MCRRKKTPAGASGGDETRAAILKAALAIFSVRGYKKATMADIAQASGTSAANIYNYFTNKQGLGVAVVEIYLSELRAQLNALAENPPKSAEEHLRAYVRTRVRYVVSHLREAPRLVELAEMLTQTAEGQDVIYKVMGEQHELAQAIVERGQKQGEFAVQDANSAADALLLAIRYFVAGHAISRFGLETAEEDLEKLLDLVCAGLRCHAA